MTNTEIAEVFRELADILLQQKENWFKVRAYRKVADEIDKLPVELSTLTDKKKLKEIPGVGKAIEKKLTEIITTGKLQLLERLKAEVGQNNIEKSRR